MAEFGCAASQVHEVKGPPTFEAESARFLRAATCTEDIFAVTCSPAWRPDASLALKALSGVASVQPTVNRPVPRVVSDGRYLAIVSQLRESITSLRGDPQALMQVMWALGKTRVFGSDVSDIVTIAVEAAAPQLKEVTPQGLSNGFWGLARLCQSQDRVSSLAVKQDDVMRLAFAIFAEIESRIEAFSGQGLSNSMWAVAALHLRCEESQGFARTCLRQIVAQPLTELSPQACANCLWATAQLQIDFSIAAPFAEAAICRILQTREVLSQVSSSLPGKFFAHKIVCEFVGNNPLLGALLPEELSMSLWSLARIFSRQLQRPSGATTAGLLSEDVLTFADLVAAEASSYLYAFSGTALSNIAWACAVLKIADRSATGNFLLAAAVHAGPLLQAYPPQAITNLCWALARMPRTTQDCHCRASFAAHVAVQAIAADRTSEFAWSDHVLITSALAHFPMGRMREVKAYTTCLVSEIVIGGQEVCTQNLFMIALNCAALGTGANDLCPLIPLLDARCASFTAAQHQQWARLQRIVGQGLQ